MVPRLQRTPLDRSLPLANESVHPLDTFYRLWQSAQLVTKTDRFATSKICLIAETTADSINNPCKHPTDRQTERIEDLFFKYLRERLEFFRRELNHYFFEATVGDPRFSL